METKTFIENFKKSITPFFKNATNLKDTEKELLTKMADAVHEVEAEVVKERQSQAERKQLANEFVTEIKRVLDDPKYKGIVNYKSTGTENPETLANIFSTFFGESLSKEFANFFKPWRT